MTTAKLRERYVDLDGTRVHYVAEDGPKDCPRFVLVHGLGGSWANWADVMPLLAERGRAIALDLGGHGLTDVPPKQASMPANLHLLQRFVHSVCDGRPAIVAGNSMGGLLTAQLAARDKRAVAGAVLIDPAIPPTPVSRPHPLVLLGFAAETLLGQRALAHQSARVSLEQQVDFTMRLVTSNPDRVSAQLRLQHLGDTLLRMERVAHADAQHVAATRSLLWQLARRDRFAATMHRILQPVLLLHGARDRLINVGSARALAAAHPHWSYVEGADKGHTPMLDYPDWVAEQLLAWLDARPGLVRKAALTSGV
ncbi:alpha/beta fold hydrolase [Flexivirga caeni]|uniref:alpha/beta fold hydrolase n=1 Tax=Flexivirga caeni TaxID=2294115 RepID=UPI00131589D9|nr:alpha/beta hydrolase [Flexivirga caeni]